MGKLLNVPLVLICVYAPNYNDDQFFSSLWSSIPNLTYHCQIMGVDFNCVLNSKLDRSSKTAQPLSRSAKSIESFIKDYGIVNPWRFKNPSTGCFSFFSPVRQSYSRIDYFLIDRKLLSHVKRCDYEAIVISDHALHLLQLAFRHKSTAASWRFNNILLTDSTFVKLISAQI